MTRLAPLLLALGLCACSTPSPEALEQRDPFEGTNRAIFGFDVWVDHHVGRPLAEGYRVVVPEPAREGLHNALVNLHAPVVLANDILQGEGKQAVHTAARIAINSTIGLGGLIDVAARIGIPYHENDFGITMGKGGVQEGSYLVLPLLGPRPPRDLLGGVIDGFLDPVSYARFHGKDAWMLGRAGVRVLDFEDRHMEDVESIERSSVDFYAATRSLYRQSREAQIGGASISNLALPDDL